MSATRTKTEKEDEVRTHFHLRKLGTTAGTQTSSAPGDPYETKPVLTCESVHHHGKSSYETEGILVSSHYAPHFSVMTHKWK